MLNSVGSNAVGKRKRKKKKCYLFAKDLSLMMKIEKVFRSEVKIVLLCWPAHCSPKPKKPWVNPLAW